MRGTRLTRSPAAADRADVRESKVLSIRRELAEGTYDLDGRLDAVIQKILDTIVMEGIPL